VKKDWKNKFLVSGFILILCIPFAGVFFNTNKDYLEDENRRSASFPVFETGHRSCILLSAVHYFNAFNSYFSDHFGFRSEFLSFYRFCKISLFSVNPFPEQVVKGSHGFYFLGNSFSDVIKESKGINNFSASELVTVEENIKTIGEECRKRGIKLYIAVAPSKLSVYGQYLPITQSDRPTKLDQLIYVMRHSQYPIIDLKRNFGSYAEKRLYYLNGTHWNSFGGFIGYRTLMEPIVMDYPNLKVLSINDFIFDTLRVDINDLTTMLSLRIPEDEVMMRPKFTSHARPVEVRLPVPDYYIRHRNLHDYEIRFVNDSGSFKALIFRDSFSRAMIPFFKESFRESVFIWTPFDRRLLDIEKPDIVIYEVIEREIEVFGKIDL
jgi:alginate O-acetyltransferase complex protein AlgJ